MADQAPSLAMKSVVEPDAASAISAAPNSCGAVGYAPGTIDNVCRCRFCKRTSDEARWRRESGRECACCARLVKDWTNAGYTKDQVEKELKEDQKVQERHNKRVLDMEAEDAAIFARGGRRGVPRQVGDKEVTFEKGDSLGMEEELGNFWPIDVYKLHKETELGPLAPKDLAVIEYKGKQHKGVVLQPFHGNAIGVIRLTNQTKWVVKSATLLGNNAMGEAYQGNLRTVATHSAKRLLVNPEAWTGQVDRHKRPKAMPAAPPPKKRAAAADDDSDDDGDFDTFLLAAGKAPLISMAAAKKEKVAKADGEKEDNEPASASRNPKGRHVDGPMALLHAPGDSKKQQKALRATNDAQQLLLRADQMFKQAGTDAGFRLLQAKAIKGTIQKFKDALTPERVAVLMDSTDKDVSMDIIGRLRDNLRKGDILHDVVECIVCGDNTPRASDLKELVKKCKDAEIMLAESVYHLVVCWAVDQHLKVDEVSSATKLLVFGSAAKEIPLSVVQLQEDYFLPKNGAVSLFQKKQIFQLGLNILQKANTQEVPSKNNLEQE